MFSILPRICWLFSILDFCCLLSILDFCIFFCLSSCTCYTSIAGWRVQHCLQNLPGMRPLLIIQIQESKLMSKSTSSIWWMRRRTAFSMWLLTLFARYQWSGEEFNINSTVQCFNFQFFDRDMKRFYWCRRCTWHWALSSHLQSIAVNQTCTKTMGKLASKTWKVVSPSFLYFCAQIGFRALRFDFVKGYSPRFQAVLNWDRAAMSAMSLCLANMPRTSTYDIYK